MEASTAASRITEGIGMAGTVGYDKAGFKAQLDMAMKDGDYRQAMRAA